MVILRRLGFSGFEVTVEEFGSKMARIVIDPFLGGSDEFSIPKSPVGVEDLKDVDAVLVTHGAFDHVGEAFEIVKTGGAKLVCGVELALHAEESGVSPEQIVRTLYGCETEIGGQVVKALYARHASFFASGSHRLSGPPLSFLVMTSDGKNIYHLGDTSLFGDLRLYGDLYHPEVLMVPVGGVTYPAGYSVVPLPPREAAMAVEMLGGHDRVAVPMHYIPPKGEGESPDVVAFRNEMKGLLPNAVVRDLSYGEGFEL